MANTSSHEKHLISKVLSKRGLRRGFFPLINPKSMCITACLLMSCNQGQLSGVSGKKSGEKNKASGSLSGDDDETSEERILDEPKPVSGAFLTCAVVDTNRTKFKEDPSRETIGCALVSDNKKVNLSAYDTELEFRAKKDNTKVSSPSEEAPFAAKWHRYGQLDRAEILGSEAWFTLRPKSGGKSSAPYKFDLQQIQSEKTAAPPEAINPSVPGVTYIPSNVFAMTGMGGWGGALYPPDLCLNGVARERVEIINTKFSKFGDAGRIFFDSTIKAVPPRPDGKGALVNMGFKSWKEADVNLNPISGPLCVISGANCLFVVTLSENVYIFDKASIDAQGITVDALKTQTRDSGCP